MVGDPSCVPLARRDAHKYTVSSTLVIVFLGQLLIAHVKMVKSSLRSDTCGYCYACVRLRLCAARGRSPEPLECAYKHILESYGGGSPGEKVAESPKPACVSCRWTSDAQFPETPPSSSDLSLEWSPQMTRSRRRRKR
ncbi:unnamed protein product [Leptosia nina]|uniref:Uncharacterized protein n=1 Tax=Leptosia nina TaxID=320188 RepID=A0AAV1K6Q0_9NEOP